MPTPGLGLGLVILSCRGTLPAVIAVPEARHDNLRDVDADVPLWRTVAMAGVSGSGKTSLAMTGPECRGSPANYLDQVRIAHLPGHKTAKAIWASNADAESE